MFTLACAWRLRQSEICVAPADAFNPLFDTKIAPAKEAARKARAELGG